MQKVHLSFEQQLDLLMSRGLEVTDLETSLDFLKHVNYFRFSGYFRHWQENPSKKENRFIKGSNFDEIAALYKAEQDLLQKCDRVLRSLEVTLRTRFAYYYAERVSPVGDFSAGVGFTQSKNPKAKRVEKYLLDNLDHSQETFISHYRDNIKLGKKYHPDAYNRMPIWVAVEASSFGSLSKLLTASKESGVLQAVSDSLGTSSSMLPSQIRSFVYLRNRIAHSARVWNHFFVDMPQIFPKVKKKASTIIGSDFYDNSAYKVFAALDYVLQKSGIDSAWLTREIEPILTSNQLLTAGITKPGSRIRP